MIVFSATHSPTGRAFVGSCRVDLDFHWAMLLAQAEEGVTGPFFELLRQDGADNFEVSEYAEAESARELTELTRDALEALAAEPIKAVQALRPTRTVKVDDALLAGAEEADPDDDVDEWAADRKARATAPAVPAVTGAKPLRDTRSTELAADMRSVIASIEARRLSQRKSAPKKVASGIRRATPSAGKAVRGESAAAKERRIKTALAEEKAARDAEKQRLVADQADEMAQILARLDARNKVADSVRRRR